MTATIDQILLALRVVPLKEYHGGKSSKIDKEDEHFQYDFLRSFEFAFFHKQLFADYVMNAWYRKKSSETTLLSEYGIEDREIC